MADHRSHTPDNNTDSLIDRISDQIRARGFSSSSDSDDDNLSKITPTPRVSILFGRTQPIHCVLGGGKPADVLLWKSKKVSGGAVAVATAVWVLFEVMEYHLLTIICNGLILGLSFVFLWSNANTFVKKSPPRIPEIQIPEDPVLGVASALRIQINRAFAVLRDVVSRRDAKKFFSVISGLWIISIVGSLCDFFTLLYTFTLLAFSVPLLYDKYEDQVDYFMEKAMGELKKQYAEFDAKVLSKVPRSPSLDRKSE